MNGRFEIGGAEYVVDFSEVTDISIRLEFDGFGDSAQPNAFGLPRATATAFTMDDFVGDTCRDGSANCFELQLNPHGNGTHTECVGHIVDERVGVGDVLQDTLLPATLISIAPERLGESGEHYYDGPSGDEDRVLTESAVETALAEFDADVFPFRALIVRTLPNRGEKRHRDYSGTNPPYFTEEAMTLIRDLGVKHLLVDLPSVDREDDGGSLPNHHVFWEIPRGSHDLVNVPSPRTITELIYVPDEVADGRYLLTIQIPEFALDAAPSRPRLFELQPA